MSGFDQHFDGPYFAVIFTNKRTDIEDEEYGKMADEMENLAKKQSGYLGIENARGEDGIGITVSYWEDEAAIKSWKMVVEHEAARNTGRETWYEWYNLRVARVERGYSFDKED